MNHSIIKLTCLFAKQHAGRAFEADHHDRAVPPNVHSVLEHRAKRHVHVDRFRGVLLDVLDAVSGAHDRYACIHGRPAV